MQGNFSGQHSPSLSNPASHSVNIDPNEILLQTLLSRWLTLFGQGQNLAPSIGLFRSLAMAYQAALLPSSFLESIYDIGVGIGLWVSAFECLVHGGIGSVRLSDVLALFPRLRWNISSLNAQSYILCQRHGGTSVSFVGKLYEELYHARNDFLHGNPVTAGSIFPIITSRTVGFQSVAPLVYGAALFAFLGIQMPALTTDTPEAGLSAII